MPDEIKTDTTVKTDAVDTTTKTDAAKTAADVGDKTVLDGVTADDGKKVDAPADWPADWREKMAAGDEKALALAKRYASPQNIFKAYLSANEKIRSGQIRQTLAEDASEAEIAAWRKDQGIPEKAEEYLKDLPEGVIVGEDDKMMLGEFAEDMHGIHADPATVKHAIGAYYRIMEKERDTLNAAEGERRVAAEVALRAEWGNEFAGNRAAIKGLLDGAPEAVRDTIHYARDAEGKGLFNNPDVLRWFLAIAREANPAATLVPAGGTSAVASVEARMAELNKLMSDKSSEYWHGPKSPGLKQEWRDLEDARLKLKARAA